MGYEERMSVERYDEIGGRLPDPDKAEPFLAGANDNMSEVADLRAQKLTAEQVPPANGPIGENNIEVPPL